MPRYPLCMPNNGQGEGTGSATVGRVSETIGAVTLITPHGAKPLEVKLIQLSAFLYKQKLFILVPRICLSKHSDTYCLWHITQKFGEVVWQPPGTQNGRIYEGLLHSCLPEAAEAFELAWESILAKYNMKDNKVMKSLDVLRTSWVLPFFETLLRWDDNHAAV